MEIKLEHLSKHFTNEKDKTVTKAVNDLDIIIPSGKLIGLLGPSGCGKSTTLYMIAGLHHPTEGKIFFDEDDVTKIPPEKRGIGLVFQNYALYPHLTVFQNVAFPLENIRPKRPKEEIASKVQEMAKLVDIEQYLGRKPSQLSGGQQQRVAIARALAKEPRVLLLDEPLSNLDARLRLQTREEIKRIQKETGVTTVFVTHDQEEAMSICDEIVVMSMGVLQQQGSPQDVYDNPKNLFVAKFLGNPPINILEGHIKDNVLYLGNKTEDEATESNYIVPLENVNVEDQDVYIGLRSEFFKVVEDNEKFVAHVNAVETLGRDKSIIFEIEGQSNKRIRAIIPSEVKVNCDEKVKLGYRKIFAFNKETGERVL